MDSAVSTHSTPGSKDLTRLRSLCLELVDYLQGAKRAVEEEIRRYPTPIPRCDAQFNYLHERRSRLSQQLESTNRALEKSASAGELIAVLAALAASDSATSTAEERALRARLKEAIVAIDTASGVATSPGG
jgi:DNA-binding FrmR family transcriptional regulator